MTLPKHIDIWMENKKSRVTQVTMPKHVERHQKLVDKILEAIIDFEYYDSVIFDRVPPLSNSDITMALKCVIQQCQRNDKLNWR